MRRGILVLIFFFIAGQVKAKDPDAYYKISSVKIYDTTEPDHEMLIDETCPDCPDELRELPGEMQTQPSPNPTSRGNPYPIPYPRDENEFGQIIQNTRDLIALGREFYELVKIGEPIIKTEYAPISVLPKKQFENPYLIIQKTQNWSLPQVKSYKVEYENGFGSIVMSYEFKIIYSYGGQVEGKGHYLTGVQIVPTSVETSWGFELESKFMLQSIQNHGTTKNPNAGAIIVLQYKGGSIIKKHEKNLSFHIMGTGQMRKL